VTNPHAAGQTRASAPRDYFLSNSLPVQCALRTALPQASLRKSTSPNKNGPEVHGAQGRCARHCGLRHSQHSSYTAPAHQDSLFKPNTILICEPFRTPLTGGLSTKSPRAVWAKSSQGKQALARTLTASPELTVLLHTNACRFPPGCGWGTSC
jgi:hypothetical protein